MSQFYITLPSDSSMNFYPNNTVAHYTTKLTERVHLDGEYEVALTEIIYPSNWLNFNDGMVMFTDTPRELLLPNKLESGYFSNESEMIDYLNESMRAIGVRDATFVYSQLTRKVSIITTEDNTIRLNDALRDYLGFAKKYNFYIGETESVTKFDLNAGMHLMYIYSDIVSYSFVGDTKTPLLRVCNTSGGKGDETCVSFTNPQYVPVAHRDFETIEININNELGNPMPFITGKSVVTLHFRRKNTLTV